MEEKIMYLLLGICGWYVRLHLQIVLKQTVRRFLLVCDYALPYYVYAI